MKSARHKFATFARRARGAAGARVGAGADLLAPSVSSRNDALRLHKAFTAYFDGDEAKARRYLLGTPNADDKRAFQAFLPKRKRGRPSGARASDPNRHALNELERRFYRSLVPGATDRAYAEFVLRRKGRTDAGTHAFETAVETLLRGMRRYRKLP